MELCPNCNAAINTGHDFCPFCNTAINSDCDCDHSDDSCNEGGCGDCNCN